MKRNIPADTKFFHYENINPKGKITDDCYVRSLATALNKDYYETAKELYDSFLDTGYAFGSKENIEDVLYKNGWIKHSQPRRTIVLRFSSTYEKYTGVEFCNEIAKENKRYFIFIGGHHVSVVVNKKIHDIWDCSYGCVGNYYTKE